MTIDKHRNQRIGKSLVENTITKISKKSIEKFKSTGELAKESTNEDKTTEIIWSKKMVKNRASQTYTMPFKTPLCENESHRKKREIERARKNIWIKIMSKNFVFDENH